MTYLVKSYGPKTCYDGVREFSFPKYHPVRLYPDEYLIVHILENYLSQRAPNGNIVVLAEEWSNDLSSRDGSKNTLQFNSQILRKIEELNKRPNNTLLLVPFLLGYHHPGVAIDIKNKTMIYLDPFGSNSKLYPEIADLKIHAEAAQFKFMTVEANQQRDVTSCGPILTASMIKFSEEFLNQGLITPDFFETPRKNLATDRLFQMYVNNNLSPTNKSYAFQETMLANRTLLENFFNEQQFSYKKAELLCAFDCLHYPIKHSVGTPPVADIEKITLFQSRLTELLFIKPTNIMTEIQWLLMPTTQPVLKGIPIELTHQVLRLSSVTPNRASPAPSLKPCGMHGSCLDYQKEESLTSDALFSKKLEDKFKQFNLLCDTLKPSLNDKAKKIIDKLQEEIFRTVRKINHNKGVNHYTDKSIDFLLSSACAPHIKKAQKELVMLYGFWEHVPLCIRQFLGVIATIIFPVAIVVHCASERGYYSTFFEKAPTETIIEKLEHPFAIN